MTLGRISSRRVELAAVAGLTIAAFVLRLIEIDQSLFGDELFTYRIVTENSLWTIFGVIAHSLETNPPLYYVSAWLAVQVGDPTVWIRLPSLILGTATVPLVYVLGLRTVGRRAALVGSALVALSPFAIFYSVESRGYAMLMFLSVLSTLALLSALRRRGFLSWLAYGGSLTALLYTHYTGVFVVLGQLGWALWTHRDHVRQLGFVCLGVGLAYLPWLPSLLDQRDIASTQALQFTARFPLSIETIVDMVARVLPGPGEPSFLVVPLRELPGRSVVAVVWATIGAALVATIVQGLRRHRAGRTPAPEPASILIVVLSLVTPLGVILYSVQPDTSWLLTRNLSASLPAFALLVGWLLTSLGPRFAMAAVGLLLAALVVGIAKTLDDDYQRPPYRQAAHFLDEAAAPADAVVQPLPFSTNLFSRVLVPHLNRTHHIVWTSNGDRHRWAVTAQGGRVFVVAPQFISESDAFWRTQLGGRFSLEAHHVYPGLVRVEVFEYAQIRTRARLVRRDGRDVILRPGGASQPVSRQPGAGFVELVRHQDHDLSVAGWAIDSGEHRPARLVAVFDGARLVVAGRPSVDRPDLAKIYGSRLERSGFNLTTVRDDAETLAKQGRLRAFAISGERAWELRPLSTDTFEDGP